MKAVSIFKLPMIIGFCVNEEYKSLLQFFLYLFFIANTKCLYRVAQKLLNIVRIVRVSAVSMATVYPNGVMTINFVCFPASNVYLYLDGMEQERNGMEWNGALSDHLTP